MARLSDTLDLSISSLLLEKRRMRIVHAVDTRIGALTRDSLRLEEMQDREFDRMLYRLEADVLSEKLVDKTVEKHVTLSVEIPASWWQHFKVEVLASFPYGSWFVMKRPVRYRTEKCEHTLRADFRQYATFPGANIVTPPGVHHYLIVPKEELSYS